MEGHEPIPLQQGGTYHPITEHPQIRQLQDLRGYASPFLPIHKAVTVKHQSSAPFLPTPSLYLHPIDAKDPIEKGAGIGEEQ
jgi:hypothetical protein